MSDSNSNSHWYILGAGAIGSLWACHLRQAGFPVTLLTRSTQPRSELQLVDGDQTRRFSVDQLPVACLATASPRIEHLLVCTKAQQTLGALAAVKAFLSENAEVILLQNGLAARQVAPLLTTQHLYIAITSDGAWRTDENTVVHAGHGETWIGCPPATLSRLPTATLNIHRCDDIEDRQWKKLAVNCAINGLTVIHNCRNGELLTIPEAIQSIHQLCAEIQAIAVAQGKSHAMGNLAASVVKTLRETADNFSSMHQDIARGRDTEIDFLNGYLCELAATHHIDCPENRRVLEAVKQREHTTP